MAMADDKVEVLTRADMQKPGALERFQERGAIGSTDVAVSGTRGGIKFENMMQVMEFAKMMALSDIGVPKHLRGNPGACLRIAIQADAWGFDPFSVADKSYSVSDRISYESQLVHAVIERRAPLSGRLRMEYSGEGPTRRCKVIGRLIGEDEPFIWEGPEFQQIKVKNSPEWSANPDKQLWYHASRDWARIYCPDVLLGVYTRDELDDTNFGPSRAREVSDLANRLPAQGEGGYDAQGIAQTLRTARGEPEPETVTKEPAKEKASQEPPKDAGGKVVEHDKAGEVIDGTVTEVVEDTVPDHPITTPTTKEEYASYASTWIMASDDQKVAEDRWASEREMRAQLKVSVTERKKLEKLLNERFA